MSDPNSDTKKNFQYSKAPDMIPINCPHQLRSLHGERVLTASAISGQLRSGTDSWNPTVLLKLSVVSCDGLLWVLTQRDFCQVLLMLVKKFTEAQVNGVCNYDSLKAITNFMMLYISS